jgi:hypothetical protein
MSPCTSIRGQDSKNQAAKQAVTHQPAISFSISIQHHLNRARRRTQTSDHQEEGSMREMIGFYFPKGGVPADVELEE